MADEHVESSKEDTSGYGAQLSIKFGNGGMINIRAANVAELVGEVNALGDVGMFIVSTAEEVQAMATLAQQFQATPVQQQGPPPQQGGNSYGGNGGGNSGRTCAHGAPMTYRSGQKNGKEWSGYFCTVKNDPNLRECPPQFNR